MGTETHQEVTGAQDTAALMWRNDSVQDLLEQFSTALTAGDGPAIAGLWETPALVLHGEGARPVTTREELEEFFGSAARYYARGIVSTRPEIERVEWLTEEIAVATVRWPYIDARSEVMGAERSTYTLQRINGDLKFRVVVMQGEIAQ